MTTVDGQTLIGEAVLTAPEHTQAWDGQVALVAGFVVDEAVCRACDGDLNNAGNGWFHLDDGTPECKVATLGVTP